MSDAQAWLTLGAMVVAVAATVAGAWVAGQVRYRWRCAGCGHAYTAHLDCGGQASPCLEGASLAAALAGTGCACQAYLGRAPRAELVHAPGPVAAVALDAPITTKKS